MQGSNENVHGRPLGPFLSAPRISAAHHDLWVGLQISTTTVESRVEITQKTGNKTTMRFNYPTPQYLSKKTEISMP